MPAVIQRLITPEGAVFPVVEFAVRSLLLFAELPEWSWSEDSAAAYVFATHGEADVQAQAFGCRAFAVVRAALPSTEGKQADSRLPIADSRETERVRTAQDFRRVYERRVSPQEAYARLEERHLD